MQPFSKLKWGCLVFWHICWLIDWLIDWLIRIVSYGRYFMHFKMNMFDQSNRSLLVEVQHTGLDFYWARSQKQQYACLPTDILCRLQNKSSLCLCVLSTEAVTTNLKVFDETQQGIEPTTSGTLGKHTATRPVRQ